MRYASSCAAICPAITLHEVGRILCHGWAMFFLTTGIAAGIAILPLHDRAGEPREPH
jgi:hypothetical protein